MKITYSIIFSALTIFSALFQAVTAESFRKLVSKKGSALRNVPSTRAVPEKIVGTYWGAWPQGQDFPPLDLNIFPDSVNVVMVSFAVEEPAGSGMFVPSKGWSGTMVDPQRILNNKNKIQDRVFLLSLGGDATHGGFFNPSVPTDTWVQNAFVSIMQIVNDYNLDGVEIQYEGGPRAGNDWSPDFLKSFKICIDKLLAKLKQQGLITAIGPWYGAPGWGTQTVYQVLDSSNYDIINMQLYAYTRSNPQSQAQDAANAVKMFSNQASKFVYGMTSSERGIALNLNMQAFQIALANTKVRGVFSWDIEHSAKTTSPQFCIENDGLKIMNDPSTPYSGSCKWVQTAPPTPSPTSASNENRCGTSWSDADSSCGATRCPSGLDSECGSGKHCFSVSKC